MMDGRLRRRETSTRWASVSHSSESSDDPGRAVMIMFVVFIVKRFDTAERHETEKISTEKGFYILKKRENNREEY